MAVFAILPKAKSPELESRIKAAVPETDYYKVSDVQYLVSVDLTARQLADKLEITFNRDLPPTAVLSVSNYSGRHSPDMWEWMKLKMESAV